MCECIGWLVWCVSACVCGYSVVCVSVVGLVVMSISIRYVMYNSSESNT